MSTRLYQGDCREVLATLPAESVHCVVTSPPYWGLRDYGIPPSVWGGDPMCEHAWIPFLSGNATSFTRESKGKSTTVNKLISQSAGRDRQIDGVSASFDLHSSRESAVHEKTKESLSKSVATGGEANAADLIDVAVPIENTSNEIPDDSFRNDRPIQHQAFTRQHTEFCQSTDSRSGPISNAPSGSLTGEYLCSESGPVSNAGCNESREVFVQGNKADTSILMDASISQQQSENIGAATCPPIKEASCTLGVLSAFTSVGTDGGPSTLGLPSGLIDHSSTTGSAKNLTTTAAIGTRKFSPIHSWMICEKCGAGKGVHGLEPTLDLYVRNAVEVFRAVRRVLRSDGVCWVNLGDSYAASPSGICKSDSMRSSTLGGGKETGRQAHQDTSKLSRVSNGLKPKDLCGVPWRVAFALQADGWWLRQDVIWAKPNPMPESVTDRCCKSHEYLFMLTKSARYYFDAEAIKEPAVPLEYATKGLSMNRDRNDGGRSCNNASQTSRNKRSVWRVATTPYSDAHFATFPPALIEPAILASTSAKGCCAACGAPWRRKLSESKGGKRSWHDHANDAAIGMAQCNHGQKAWDTYEGPATTGWAPGCACGAEVVPATVLDPFFGSGTTGLVCDRLQRDCIGIDLNPQYAAMAADRITDDAPLFARVDSLTGGAAHGR